MLATGRIGSRLNRPRLLAGTGGVNELSVAVNNAGTTAIGWSEEVATGSVVAGAAGPAGRLRPRRLSPAPTAFGVVTAVDADGRATIGWEGASDGTVNVATRTARGSWRSDTVATTRDPRYLSVATNARGETALAWRAGDGDLMSIQAATRRAGTVPWSAAVTVSSGTSDEPALIQLSPTGTAAILWTHVARASDGSVRYLIDAASHSRGRWLPSRQISGGPDDEFANAGVDRSGRATAVWLASGSVATAHQR